jgi:hypothetical protein
MRNYFFKIGDKAPLVDILRQFLYSLFYVTSVKARVSSDVFDQSMVSMLAEFRKFHGLGDAFGAFWGESLLDEATYLKIGELMNDVEVEFAALHDPEIRKLLLGDPCADWTDTAAVVGTDKFVGWGTKGIAENCFDYCKEQLRIGGRSMKSPWWGDATKMQPDIYQLFVTQDVAGMKKGIQPRQFVAGVKYLKQALKDKTPVVAGVDDGPGSPNADQVTDHFVTIVGMGTDKVGKYFHFFDNATGDKAGGTSAANRLYPDCTAFKIEGTADNQYARDVATYDTYRVTQIRETK